MSLIRGGAGGATGVTSLTSGLGASLQRFGLIAGSKSLTSLGTATMESAENFAGPAALIYRASKIIADAAVRYQEERLQNAHKEKALAAESFNYVRSKRFSSELSPSDFLERKRQIERAATGHGNQNLLDVVTGALGLERTGQTAAEIQSRARGAQANILDRRLRQLGGQALVDATSVAVAGKDKNVEYLAHDWRQIGLFDRLLQKVTARGNLSAWLGFDKWMPNYGAMAQREESEKMSIRMKQSEIFKREEDAKYWNLEAANRPIVQEHERHIRAMEHFQIERTTQWNPL